MRTRSSYYNLASSWRLWSPIHRLSQETCMRFRAERLGKTKWCWWIPSGRVSSKLEHASSSGHTQFLTWGHQPVRSKKRYAMHPVSYEAKIVILLPSSSAVEQHQYLPKKILWSLFWCGLRGKAMFDLTAKKSKPKPKLPLFDLLILCWAYILSRLILSLSQRL